MKKIILIMASLVLLAMPAYAAKTVGSINQKAGVHLYAGQDWQVVERKSISEATTSVTFSSLLGDADIEYRAIIYLVSGTTGSNPYIKMRLNNDSGSNYGYQYIQASSVSLSTIRGVDTGIWVGYCASGATVSFSDVLIFSKTGYVRPVLVSVSENISGATIGETYISANSWNNANDNLINIVFTSQRTNGIGAGTDIILMARRMAGSEAPTGRKYPSINVKGKVNAGVFQLVERQSVSVSTTSCTFLNLNGNTDIIYLVKCRMFGGSASSCYYYLRLNNSSADYGVQFMDGGNTTKEANRHTTETAMTLNLYKTSIDNVTHSETLIYAKSGNVRAGMTLSSINNSSTNVGYIMFQGHSWNNVNHNVTSIVITSSETNGIGVGSVIEVWALRLGN